MPTPQDHLEATGKQWLAAREVIAKVLAEIMGHSTGTKHNAAAIIARLASHEPPLLICTADEMKE